MPFVSVIVPAYNAEKYIEKCLQSLEEQTFKDFDVILIDDCSTDNTSHVVCNFCKNHNLDIKYFKNSQNSGVAKSRNTGVKVSNSEYIAFCDSDDWYEHNYLELMVGAAKKNDADMVFCNSKKVLADGQTIKIESIRAIPPKVNHEIVLTMGIDSLCCLIVRRIIIEDTPMPEIRNGEDMAIIPLMIIKAKKFGFVKQSIYNYFCRSGSLSLMANEQTVKSLKQSFDHIVENHMSDYYSEIEYIGIRNFVYGSLLNHFKYSNDVSYAKEIVKEFEGKFRCWYKNKYMCNMPFYKRIFVWFAHINFYAGVKALVFIHKKLTERKG